MLSPSLHSSIAYAFAFALSRKVIGVLALLGAAAGLSGARELRFHGPIIQWHDDPTREATFTWIEQVAPDELPAPVWRRGQAAIGYGDEDDRTILSDMEDAYERVYLAKRFEAPSIGPKTEVTLTIRYDDAFVAYINGHEVARSANIRGQHASAKVSDDHEADTEEIFHISNAHEVLRRGKNLISIEGHNVRKSSSDFTLHPRLFINGRETIGMQAEWHYLAGADPSIRWHLSFPAVVPQKPLPRAEQSNWLLSVRARSGGRYLRFRPNQTSFGSTDNLVFSADVSGLRPDTSYDYDLSADGRSVKQGWFRTAPSALSRPMRFAVGGDVGTDAGIPMCRAVGKDDPLFVVLGGDLAYANGRADHLWYDWIDNWTELVKAPDGRAIPMIVAIGNHETRSFSGLRKREIWKGFNYLSAEKRRAPFFFSLFDLPEGDSNFTVDFGSYMSFVVLDSGHAQKVKVQTAWLEEQLRQKQQVNHLFAVYHEPAWGTGAKKNNQRIQEKWCPLFERYQIDCAFEHDHHTYKRSKLITGGMPDPSRGILYLGDGAWGAKLRPITEGMLSEVGARRYLARWEAKHHAIRVTISPDGSRRYQAIDVNRRVFDSYLDRRSRRPVH